MQNSYALGWRACRQKPSNLPHQFDPKQLDIPDEEEPPWLEEPNAFIEREMMGEERI